MTTRLSEPPAVRAGAASAETSAVEGARDAVTVAEAQRMLLPGSRIVGGSSGLGRRVSWATSLRSRPPAFEPRGGGEFVLAARETLESLRQVDQALSAARILEGLAQAGAAALALQMPIPRDAVEAADALGLPLVELTEGAAILDVERGIIGLVLDRNNELQRRASDFYRQLAHLSVESQGLDAILQQASALTGRTVAFEDDRFRLRGTAAGAAVHVPPRDGAGLSSADERGRLAELARSHPLNAMTPSTALLPAARWGTARYTAPVVTRERLRGWVSLCGPAETLTELDQMAASRLAAICALEVAKDDAVLAAEQRVQGDLLDELLRPYGDAEVATRRALQAGLTLDGTFGVYVFGLEGDAEAPALADAFSRHLRRLSYANLARAEGAEVLLLCQLASGRRTNGQHALDGDARCVESSNPSASKAVEDVAARAQAIGSDLFGIAENVAGNVGAGASRPHVSLAALPQAAREAREALRIGRRVYGAGRLVCFADLGLYRVLHALRDTPELESFFDQTLGPLIAYDRRTGQNLIQTLEAFFACNGNLTQTAKQLRFHRNSLLYRVQRIQEILDMNLEDAETRLSLQVALKARRLLA